MKCSTYFKPNRSWQIYCSPACQRHNPRKSRATQAYQDRRRELLNRIKTERGCSRCGYSDHPAALDFNHIPERGPKLFNISQDPKRKWADIELEIAKCEILCANCHRIHTHSEKHWRTMRKDLSGHACV